MNRSEPSIFDIDLADARLVDETSKVNWHAVTEGEAAAFGLALSMYRDQVHVQDMRRAAMQNSFGTLISASVLSVLFLLAGVNPFVALGVIIASMTARTCLLVWANKETQSDVQVFEDQALECADNLAKLHPVVQS